MHIYKLLLTAGWSHHLAIDIVHKHVSTKHDIGKSNATNTLGHTKTNQVPKHQREFKLSRISIKTQQASSANKKLTLSTVTTSCMLTSEQHKRLWSAAMSTARHRNIERRTRWLHSCRQRCTNVSTTIEINWRCSIACCCWGLRWHLLKFQQHCKLYYQHTTYIICAINNYYYYY